MVTIAVETHWPGADNPLLRDPFFGRFFDLPERPPRRRGVSAGSGVNVDASWVLTNHHVVENAERVIVTQRDGRERAAEPGSSDADTDIARLRVGPERSLADLSFADRDALKVGGLLVAINNPCGLGLTVTLGIGSAIAAAGSRRPSARRGTASPRSPRRCPPPPGRSSPRLGARSRGSRAWRVLLARP
jgi:S1-C subfamily serine protease